MGKPEFWHSLQTFDVTPSKTFFGMDSSKGHCFTVQKDVGHEMMEFFDLGEGNLQLEITLAIGDEDFPATLRLVRQNRSRTYKLKPDELPYRELINISWKSYTPTQEAIRIAFQSAFDKISLGEKNSEQTALFVHIRGNAFFLYPMTNMV